MSRRTGPLATSPFKLSAHSEWWVERIEVGMRAERDALKAGKSYEQRRVAKTAAQAEWDKTHPEPPKETT